MPIQTNARSARIVRLASPDSEALYADLIQLAEMARTGAITGVAYSAFRPRGDTDEGLLGRARADLPRAYFGAKRLADTS